MPEPRRHPLAVLVTALVGAAGPALALALVTRLLLWPPSELGGLFLLIACSVAVPAQLVPALGLLWARRLAKGWAISAKGWTALAAWGLASAIALLFGVLVLLLRD